MQPTALSTHLILLLGQICFASLPVAGRMAMANLAPGAIVLVRMTGGAIIFSLIARTRTQHGPRIIRRADLPFLILCAVLGVAANQELFIQGLARSTAINASVLGSTIPVFTALVAIAMGKEPVRTQRLAGIVVAFAGAATLVGADRLSTSSEHLLGSSLVLINSLCYGTFLVVVRPLAEKYDPMVLLSGLFVVGVPMVAPFGIAAFASSPAPDGTDIAFFAFLVAVPTIAAYGLVQTALKRAESTLVAAYIYLQPIFALIGAMIFLDERPTLRLALCAPIILAGVALAARKSP